MSVPRWVVIAVVLVLVGGFAHSFVDIADRVVYAWWLHRGTVYVGSPSDFK